MNTDKHRLDQITELIIGCVFKVSNALGVGYLEKVYENAMVVALRKAGLKVLQQVVYKVIYEDEVVGEYIADLVVEDLVLLELKHVKDFDSAHVAVCLNYLRASSLPACLLINFGKPRAEVKRLVL